MQTVDLGGVHTIWDDQPGPLSASLTFGVGVRHESFRTLEVAHLVEHLVMAGVPRSSADIGGRVDEDTTTFTVSGQVEDAVAFLNHVAAWFRTPDLSRLGMEAGILELEDGRTNHVTMRWAADLRYGARSVGLVGQRSPGASTLEERHVLDFVREHHVAANAVLVLSGSPPANLDIRLPAGPRPTEEDPCALPGPYPFITTGTAPQPAVSGVAPRAIESVAMGNVLKDRLFDDLRTSRGLVYHVDYEALRLTVDTSLVVLHADPREADAQEVVRAMWTHLAQLATAGPTEEELARQRDAFDLYASTPGSAQEALWHEGYRHLFGGDSHAIEETQAQLQRMTGDDVRSAAAALKESAIIGLPAEPSAPFEGVHASQRLGAPPDLVPERRFTGRRLRGAKDLEVRADGEGIVLVAGGERVGSRWSDVVGVGRAQDIRQLTLADGSIPWLCSRHLRRADELFELVDHHTADVSYTLLPDHVVDC